MLGCRRDLPWQNIRATSRSKKEDLGECPLGALFRAGLVAVSASSSKARCKTAAELVTNGGNAICVALSKSVLSERVQADTVLGDQLDTDDSLSRGSANRTLLAIALPPVTLQRQAREQYM